MNSSNSTRALPNVLVTESAASPKAETPCLVPRSTASLGFTHSMSSASSPEESGEPSSQAR